MLGLMLLLVLLPGTGLATLILLGAIGSGIRNGFDVNPFPAICLLSIPHFLVYWGMKLMAGLRTGFHAAIRRKLLVFYLVVAAYCCFWLFAPFTHEGGEVQFFAPIHQIIGTTLLIIPILTTLFIAPEAKCSPTDFAGRPMEINQLGKDAIAWLASRIR
jgi:hypothetical protein